MHFIYTVDFLADEPIMLLNKHIGIDPEDGPGIMGDQFQSELLALDGMGKKRIQIWINSSGGNVDHGWSIYNTILKTNTKVDTYCMGLAASMAAVIFQAGRKRYMMEGALLMYHNPSGSDDNKALDAIAKSLANQVGSRSGIPVGVVEKMMDRTTWVTAFEALEMGLCDEVEMHADFNKRRASADVKAMMSETNKIINSVLIPTKTKSMKGIANRLGLNPEANEDSILQEIARITNKMTTAEALAQTRLDEITNRDNTIKLKDGEIEKLKNDLNAEKAAKVEAENASKKAAAKTYVANLVKIGKIKNEADVIQHWEDQHLQAPETIEKMFGAVAASGSATNITNSAEAASNERLTSVVSRAMGELKNKYLLNQPVTANA